MSRDPAAAHMGAVTTTNTETSTHVAMPACTDRIAVTEKALVDHCQTVNFRDGRIHCRCKWVDDLAIPGDKTYRLDEYPLPKQQFAAHRLHVATEIDLALVAHETGRTAPENGTPRCAACGSKIRWSQGYDTYLNRSGKSECPSQPGGHAPLAPDALGRNVEPSERAISPE